jgi:hypothetical protein
MNKRSLNKRSFLHLMTLLGLSGIEQPSSNVMSEFVDVRNVT